ncbi:low molecular weight protein-tyrosine-phosphatase [Metabacillus sp. 113a]|uniref:low molecular weight protein-tyrosine-phosphatase n=1 Tax=Metabacillus sp. 113a TaxID=3404706 RepID=UPI003CF0989E
MIHVLFVCLGNICRSPMAEAVFREMVKKEGLENKITADSAGTGDWHIGKAPHEGTQEILTRSGISFEGLAARQFIKEDLPKFDYIICMDAENLGNVRRMAGYSQTGHIGRLLDFVEEAEVLDVPDPYFTGNFDEVYELVSSGCRGLLEEIKENEKLY